MKMTNLIFGVILGLLAVVHSTPVNTVTQIPDKAEDDVIREAVTDGFLIDHFPLLTSKSPNRNTTVQASQQPPSDSTQSDMFEGSAADTSDKSTTFGFLQFTTTTQSTSTVLPRHADNSSSDASATQIPQSSFSPSSGPNDAQSSATPDHMSVSQTTDASVSSFDFLSTQSSDLGSGDGGMIGQYSTTTSSRTSSSNIETSTALSTSTAAIIRQNNNKMFARSEGSGEGSGEESGSGLELTTVPTIIEETIQKKNSLPNLIDPKKSVIIQEDQKKGHNTPGWMIIVGFIVGLAALVMLFIAIATRDKWNGPKQASQLETKANSSNQERELEMETFLHKDNPRENGKAAEYTVIPLDELPGKYSSH